MINLTGDVESDVAASESDEETEGESDWEALLVSLGLAEDTTSTALPTVGDWVGFAMELDDGTLSMSAFELAKPHHKSKHQFYGLDTFSVGELGRNIYPINLPENLRLASIAAATAAGSWCVLRAVAAEDDGMEVESGDEGGDAGESESEGGEESSQEAEADL